MDFTLYALEEVTMGNRFFVEYLKRISDWVSEMPLPEIRGSRMPATELYFGVMNRVCTALGIEIETEGETI
jgi:hypothetical protein